MAFTFRNNYEINIKFFKGVERIPSPEGLKEYTSNSIKSVTFEEDVIENNCTVFQTIIENVSIEELDILNSNSAQCFIMIKILNFHKDENDSIDEVRRIVDNVFYIENCVPIDNINTTSYFKVKIEGVGLYAWYARQESLLSTVQVNHQAYKALDLMKSKMEQRWDNKIKCHFEERDNANNYMWEDIKVPNLVKDLDAPSYIQDKFKAFFWPTFFFMSDIYINYNYDWKESGDDVNAPCDWLMVNLAYNGPTTDVNGEEFREHFNQVDWKLTKVTYWNDWKKLKHDVGGDGLGDETHKSHINIAMPISAKIYSKPPKYERYKAKQDSKNSIYDIDGISIGSVEKFDLKKYRMPVDAKVVAQMRAEEKIYNDNEPKLVSYFFRDIDIQYLNFKRKYNFHSEKFADRLVYKRTTFKKYAATTDEHDMTNLSREEIGFNIEHDAVFLTTNGTGGRPGSGAAGAGGGGSGQPGQALYDIYGNQITKASDSSWTHSLLMNEYRAMWYKRLDYEGMNHQDAYKLFQGRMDEIRAENNPSNNEE